MLNQLRKMSHIAAVARKLSEVSNFLRHELRCKFMPPICKSSITSKTERQSKNQSQNDYFPNFETIWRLGKYSDRISQADVNFCLKAAMSTAVAGQNMVSSDKLIQDYSTVLSIIRNYQVYGHLVAQLDPLGIMYEDRESTISDHIGSAPSRVVRRHPLKEVNLDQTFVLPTSTFIGGSEKSLPLREIIRRLEMVYCRHIGAEYMYIENIKEVEWLRQQLETPDVLQFSKESKNVLLSRIIRAKGFEDFLAKKFGSEKRFGLEGCEILIPAFKHIIDVTSAQGVDMYVIGMAHRGRLNVLANVIRKPLEDIFGHFIGLQPDDQGSGDVKYHLGTMMERINRISNKKIRLTLIANPSHLEMVCPVAVGRAKAEQFYRGDHDGKKVLCILIHGDASFCGQGIVYETIHFADLPGHKPGGVIHLIINNQIGFTTDPRFSRSSVYPTDLARVVNAPVFHVNADDPESTMHVCSIASKWRQRFGKDIIVDLVCYRKNGHNEVDQPMFTQPLMYTKIAKKEPVTKMYSDQLIKEGVITAKEVKAYEAKYVAICEEGFKKAQSETKLRLIDWIDSPWPGFFSGKDPMKIPKTGVNEKILTHIGKVFSSPPPKQLEFVIHKGLETRILKQRMKMVGTRQADWALGEAFAFGSLLKEGIHVRLSGQDVQRGTFAHRHHILHHQTIDKRTYCPIQNLYADQAAYTITNSSLSEVGVLAFEHGFTLTNPNALVIWEAQFGDFYNTAQALVDVYLSAGESKWIRQCGLVMLLPHGLEGMGPEHSSARVERFLQLCSDDPDVQPPDSPETPIRQLRETNWIVANCTTPANLFHILRRQIAMPFRKPLIVFTPKSLLRHPLAVSSFDEMIEGTEFKRVIPENGSAAKQPDKVKKLILCTGKVYYDLLSEHTKRKMNDVIALTRVEQLCPFPYDLLKQEIAKFPKAGLSWAQEEHKNQGGWYYMLVRLNAMLKNKRQIKYHGRPVSPAPATGSRVTHILELQKLLNDAFSI